MESLASIDEFGTQQSSRSSAVRPVVESVAAAVLAAAVVGRLVVAAADAAGAVPLLVVAVPGLKPVTVSLVSDYFLEY